MASIGWDAGRIHTAQVLPPQQDEEQATMDRVQEMFYAFIQQFHINGVYIYRDQLRQNIMLKRNLLEVDMGDLISFNQELAHNLSQRPADFLPLFESAVKQHAKRILYTNAAIDVEMDDFQVTLHSSANLIKIRHLNANSISKLIRISGIIIAASPLTSKATALQIRCKSCSKTKRIPIQAGFSGISMPRTCDLNMDAEANPSGCGLDPYVVDHDKSKCVDQQVLKLQEAPDDVPVGELPRHVLLSADRELTNRVVPGSRATIMGIYSVFQNKSGKGNAIAIRTPYIRVVGIRTDTDATGRRRTFTDEEEEEFIAMSREPGLYQKFANSIAPSIFGNHDIKKAISCLLFGGSKNVLPDGMKLRGDINVLLLGDPGTAKSQLLKFVEKVAPIAVYTSGKGSSAAGLTASVVREPSTREFYLEGGAMVLADGGVVCIDEFDKMRDEDRVAIHEAMEQQTISIAKAGITTILNSRTSVLAAANPVFGRYDDMRSAGENIDFQTTILSRFDMIFILKDEHNESRDMTIARHVMNVHMDRPSETAASEISIEKMKNYISYCKLKSAPRLTKQASEKLSSHFVGIRSTVGHMQDMEGIRTSIPITVRQLEAIIRISESLAKMTLSPRATEEHVDEAIRLFKFSTMDAVNAGTMDGQSRQQGAQEVRQVEDAIRRRVAIGSQIPTAILIRELESQGFNTRNIERAIFMLERQETLQYTNMRKSLRRQRM
ncbi:minichromosome maintenance protein 5 [Lobosporangium transversale]|uniref:DNA replication licensing factor MCM5 n=1 Tax=Lobosporangium transversale TaxID=64571 RepID=A0A1Y2GJE4_9FUNG|nr:MCM-domain-containing protein [Lobosporangium transversale]KAF9898444.1 minichromosome maintenance protein 5 [Lobosporangium transversale]ORZ12590.1 MCM-domain-containing protein [Lobosporangium transversale]|eukprot:XP_021880209.1 MCM-domain-containing protein [Lobosporangium transversale]